MSSSSSKEQKLEKYHCKGFGDQEEHFVSFEEIVKRSDVNSGYRKICKSCFNMKNKERYIFKKQQPSIEKKLVLKDSYRCRGFGDREKHFVSFEEIVKSNRKSNGVETMCKSCERTRTKEKRKRIREYNILDMSILESYRCRGYGERKEHSVSYEEIVKRADSKNGVETICKECQKKYNQDNSYDVSNARALNLIYFGMQSSSKKRKMEMKITKQEWFELANDQDTYEPQGTSFVFKLKRERGWFNTLSCDRIDDSKEYILDNIQARPHILNSVKSLNDPDFVVLDKKRYEERIESELKTIVDNFNNEIKRHPVQGKLYNMSTKYGKLLDMSVTKFISWLTKMFIQQGGRCAYTGMPMNLEKSNCFGVCMTRKVKCDGWEKENCCLIIEGLNNKHSGRRGEDRQTIINGSFNQEYWNESTNSDVERIEKVREHDRKILEKLFKDKQL